MQDNPRLLLCRTFRLAFPRGEYRGTGNSLPLEWGPAVDSGAVVGAASASVGVVAFNRRAPVGTIGTARRRCVDYTRPVRETDCGRGTGYLPPSERTPKAFS